MPGPWNMNKFVYERLWFDNKHLLKQAPFGTPDEWTTIATAQSNKLEMLVRMIPVDNVY